ncbi:MAG TPA: tetratricopeptide repeat protein [Anaerolineae bacterium]|nr:tetratricopeptide repeat protein [Anaerolineae bacterium]HNU03206.1 tetratricopeptide repeat protein [Anaerolineae bacterium]
MSLTHEQELSGTEILTSKTPSRAKDRHRDFYLALTGSNVEDVSRIDKSFGQIKHAVYTSSDFLTIQEAATELFTYLYRKGLWHEQLQIAYRLLTIAMSSGVFDEMWIALDMVGSSLIRMGQWEHAEESYDFLVRIAEQRGDHAALVTGLKALGYLHERRYEWDQADECYQRCLTILQSEGSDMEVSEIKARIRGIDVALGRDNAALNAIAELEALYQQENDERRKADILREIGDLHRGLDQLEEALVFYQRSADVSQRCGHLTALARTRGAVGNVAVELEQYDDALAFYNDALRIFEQIGNRPEAAYVLLDIGDVYGHLDDDDLALDRYRQAVVILEEAGDPPFLSLALGSIGVVCIRQGQLSEAEMFLKRAIAIDETLGLPILELHRETLEQLRDL